MKHVSALWSLIIAVLVLVIALGLVDIVGVKGGVTGAAVYYSKSKEAVGMAWAVIAFIFMLAVYIYIKGERKNKFF